MKDFPQATASEQKETQRRRRRRRHLGEAPGLWQMFGVRSGFIDAPRDASRLRFTDRAAQVLQFLAGQEALAAASLNLSIPRAGLVPSGTMPARPANAYMLPTTASTRLAWNGFPAS